MRKFLFYGLILAGMSDVLATNSSLLEIFGDEKAEIPNVEPLQTGKLSSDTRRFDLICTGRCSITPEGENLQLDMTGHDIPDLFTIDSEGHIAFAVPSPMCTIKMPKGRVGAIQIDLVKISNKMYNEDILNYLCLGIRKPGSGNYFGVLYLPKVTAQTSFSTNNEINKMLDVWDDGTQRYKPYHCVELDSEEVVELVPLISTQNMSEGAYKLAVAGAQAIGSGIPIGDSPNETFDFGSVFRIEVGGVKNTVWTEATCNLSTDVLTEEDFLYNLGQIGVGSIKIGDTFINSQLLGISSKGQLAYSSDGIRWNKWNKFEEESDNMWSSTTYGNGVWCAFREDGIVKTSVDGVIWSEDISVKGSTPANDFSRLVFANGIFMTIGRVIPNGDGTFYCFTSSDGEHWNNVGKFSDEYYVLQTFFYNNGRWMCSDDQLEHMHESKDNGKTWAFIGAGICFRGYLYKDSILIGDYANRYSYMIYFYGCCIARSANGKVWTKVTWPPAGEQFQDKEKIEDEITSNESLFSKYAATNITFYKDKLYVVNGYGTHCFIGTFSGDTRDPIVVNSEE